MDWRSTVVVALTALAPALSDVSGTAAQNSSPLRPEIPFSRLKPDAVVPLTLEPGALVVPDAIWIPQRDASTVVRLHAGNNTPAAPVAIGKPPCASLTLTADALWVPTCNPGLLARVDVAHGNVTSMLPLTVAEPAGAIATAARSVWVITDARGVVSRIDPETGKPVAEVYVAARPFAVVAEDDVVWVSSEQGDTLTRIDGHTNRIIETINVGPRPGPLAIGDGAVWTLNRGDGSITRVDLKSNKAVATIAVGDQVTSGAMAVGDGAVWVSAPGMPIVRIDTRTNRVTHRFVGDAGGAVVFAHRSLWVHAGPNSTWRIDPRLVAATRP